MGTSTDQSPSQSKRALWQNHINQWQASGQTQQSYCLEHNLNTHTFGYWKKKLLNNNQLASATQKSAFIPVQAQARPLPSGITLSLPNGCQLSGINEYNIALVKQLTEWL